MKTLGARINVQGTTVKKKTLYTVSAESKIFIVKALVHVLTAIF